MRPAAILFLRDRLLKGDRRRILLLAAAWGGLLLICIIAFLRTGRYGHVLIDDAFITFRHSRNIVEGYGFTCNPGEHVEGTSSLLFTLVMALPIALGLEPLGVARLIGALVFAACPILAYLGVTAVHRDGWSRLLGLGAAAWVASSSTLAFHSQTGMETLLYTALLTLGLVLSVRETASGWRQGSWALVLGVASLCRPEGFAFFFALLILKAVGVVARRGWRTRDTWRPLVTALALFSLVTLPFLLFRIVYFGELVPNPVIAKSGALSNIGEWWHRAPEVLSRSPDVQRVLAFLLHRPMFGFALGALLLPRSRYAGFSCLTVFAGCAAVYIWNGGDWMPNDRLLAPSIPALAMGAGIGLRGLFFHAEQKSGRWHIASTLFVACILALGLYTSGKSLPPHKEPVVLEQMQLLTAALRENREEGDNVASDIAGSLPFYWGIPAIDACGLCDPHIARTGRLIFDGIGKLDQAYLARQEPVFFAFNFPGGAVSLYLTKAWAPYRDKYYLVRLPPKYLQYELNPPTILVRKDRPNVEKLAENLGAQLVDPGEELRRTGFLKDRPHR